jgi:hypothetical protein
MGAAVSLEAAANESGDTPQWQRAHEELLALAEKRAGLDADEGRWLLEALRVGAHVRLGYGGFPEYVERLFGYSPRFTQERLRVAEALEELPDLYAALANGALSWSVVRELTRVATSKTESEWLSAAQGRTARDVERLVSGHKPGNRPTDACDPAAKRHFLKFEVSAETLATVRDALAKLRRDAGGSLDDDAALLLMARHILGGPKDEGRASYQVYLNVCERCGAGQQLGSGELVDVSPEVIETANCDAQHVRAILGEKSTPATQTIPPAVRREVFRRDAKRCVVPGCRHAAFIDVHHIDLREDGGSHEPDNLVCLCGAHHLALHRGQLSIQGKVSTGLTFRHADGTIYGGAPKPREADVRSKVFSALRNMGYRESEARLGIERAAAHMGASADAATLLKQALSALTESIGKAARR